MVRPNSAPEVPCPPAGQALCSRGRSYCHPGSRRYSEWKVITFSLIGDACSRLVGSESVLGCATLGATSQQSRLIGRPRFEADPPQKSHARIRLNFSAYNVVAKLPTLKPGAFVGLATALPLHLKL